MTIAVVVKVHDGMVLGTDTAATLSVNRAGVGEVVNAYFGAERVFHLHTELPVALLSWGSGALGDAPISGLTRDLRRRLMGEAKGWGLDANNYEMSVIAERVRQFFFEERCEELREAGEPVPDFGLVLAGYSSGRDLPELYEIAVEGGNCGTPRLVRDGDSSGIAWFGHSEALRRLVLGISNALRPALLDAGVKQDIGALIDQVKSHSEELFAPAAMPFQDAIELGEFLVQTAITYARFVPGREVLGGSVNLATLNRHQGFKWVKRRHYFDRGLNEPWYSEHVEGLLKVERRRRRGGPG